MFYFQELRQENSRQIYRLIVKSSDQSVPILVGMTGGKQSELNEGYLKLTGDGPRSVQTEKYNHPCPTIFLPTSFNYSIPKPNKYNIRIDINILLPPFFLLINILLPPHSSYKHNSLQKSIFVSFIVIQQPIVLRSIRSINYVSLLI